VKIASFLRVPQKEADTSFYLKKYYKNIKNALRKYLIVSSSCIINFTT